MFCNSAFEQGNLDVVRRYINVLLLVLSVATGVAIRVWVDWKLLCRINILLVLVDAV